MIVCSIVALSAFVINSAVMEEDHVGRWPPEMESYFVDRCIEGTNMNKRHGRGWGRDGYEWLVNELQKIGFRTNKKVVKQKWEYMKKMFRTWEALRNNYIGLGVHPETGHIDAPESFWEEACKVNSKMKNFKKRAVDTDLYAKYYILFAGLLATGLHSWAPLRNALMSNRETKPVYRPSPPHEGSGDSEDSQFGQDSLNSSEASSRQISPSASTARSGYKRTRADEVTSSKKSGRGEKREGHRGSRRSWSSMLSKSLDDMTARLFLAMESRQMSLRECEKEKEYAEYHSIIDDIKHIPGWNEENNVFHSFVLNLMHDNNKKMAYRTFSSDSAKLLWLQYEWTKTFGQPPPPI